MEDYTIKNQEGLTCTITNRGIFTTEKHVPIMGGMENNPTWNEYIDDFLDELKPHLELIKQAITDLDWIGTTGGEKANDTFFIFSDGRTFSFSWRAWGDLMQAIVNKKEGYMTYYM